MGAFVVFAYAGGYRADPILSAGRVGLEVRAPVPQQAQASDVIDKHGDPVHVIVSQTPNPDLSTLTDFTAFANGTLFVRHTGWETDEQPPIPEVVSRPGPRRCVQRSRIDATAQSAQLSLGIRFARRGA